MFLLYYNHLPNREELADFSETLKKFRHLPKGVEDLIRQLPKSAPPMHALRTLVSLLGCYDTTAEDLTIDYQRRKALRLVAQVPTIVAYFHRHRQGKEFVPPDLELGEAANFLWMINGEKPTEDAEKTLDVC